MLNLLLINLSNSLRISSLNLDFLDLIILRQGDNFIFFFEKFSDLNFIFFSVPRQADVLQIAFFNIQFVLVIFRLRHLHDHIIIFFQEIPLFLNTFIQILRTQKLAIRFFTDSDPFRLTHLVIIFAQCFTVILGLAIFQFIRGNRVYIAISFEFIQILF